LPLDDWLDRKVDGMSGYNEHDLEDCGLEPALPGVSRPKGAFHGPDRQGLATFGWYRTTHSAFPSRARFTITRMIHRPQQKR
jgi:hypothetical protein